MALLYHPGESLVLTIRLEDMTAGCITEKPVSG